MANWQDRIIGLERVDVKRIVKNPLNYREHPTLQRNMMNGILDDIGWVDAVIVNKTTGNLVDGHMRVDEALKNGTQEIPVIYVNLTEDEERVVLATFDPVSTFAKESSKLLSGLIEKISPDNSSLSDLVGRVAKRNRIEFGVDDIETAKQRKEDFRENEQEKNEELIKSWGVEQGQLWRIPSRAIGGESHRLFCGDSSDKQLVKKLIGKSKGKLFVTDPPYGIEFDKKATLPTYRGWEGVKGDERKGVALREWFNTILDIWMPYIDDDSAYYIWSGVYEEGFAIYYSLLDSGLHIQSQIIWVKDRLSLGNTDYHWRHESCWYAFKKGKNHRWFGERDKTTVWNIDRLDAKDYIHPMQKPIELYSLPMQYHTVAGDICFDPFSGSGTQIVAAEQHGRLCYAMEIDTAYVAKSLDRFSDIGLVPVLEK